jgi:nitroreductase
MEFKDVIAKRQSTRAYLDKPVQEDKLNRILEAARLAPSAHNGQKWKFVVVRDPGRRQQMMKACNNQPMIGQAPVVIAAIALDPEWKMPCGVYSHPVDLGIAVEHMALAAVDEGLGACWVGAFSQDKVKEVLQIPGRYVVVGVLPIGYSNQQRAPSSRKSIEEIVCYEMFTE